MTHERHTVTADDEIRDRWYPMVGEINKLAAKVRRRNRWIIALVVALLMESAALTGLLIDQARWGW